MKILIVSATIQEIVETLSFFEIEAKNNKKFYHKDLGEDSLSILIVGVGSYSMIYNLATHLEKYEYDLIINAGIAGTYKKSLKNGDVVIVEKEYIGDLGIDDNGKFVSLWDKDDFFFEKDKIFYTDKNDAGALLNPYFEIFERFKDLKRVKSVSLNTVSGSEKSILKLKEKFNADIENMEGAAFFYVCLKKQVKFVEIRAISNYVEPRNKESWQIMTAITELNTTMRIIILDYLNYTL